MLPTFVIGLREGLEASLIVGIVAAFLKQNGRRDLLKWVAVGVTAATALCITVGVILDAVSRDLPQRKQEGLETVIGALAIVMVTYMILWMRRHARDLKGELEGAAGSALASGSAWTLVVMAFLAVLREGLETAVFLLAAFNESKGSDAPIGAVAGIAVALVLGYAIYKGGVTLNLAKFFRITGVVLVAVAAGLVLTALHTAHEAGWLNSGQQRTVDLSSFVRPGSVQASLLTGMLGVQPHPVLVELIGWSLYIVPLGIYVAFPRLPNPSRTLVRRAGLSLAAVGTLAGVALVVAAPSTPDVAPLRAADGTTSAVVSLDGAGATVRTTTQHPASPGTAGAVQDVALRRTGTTTTHGVAAVTYQGTLPTTTDTTRPATLTVAALAQANGGRLPIGIRSSVTTVVPVTYTGTTVLSAVLEPRTRTVLGLTWHETLTIDATLPGGGTVTVDTPVADATSSTPDAAVTAAAADVRGALDDHDRGHRMTVGGVWCLVLAALALLVAGLASWPRRRRDHAVTEVPAPLDKAALTTR